jgi:hypothetical protein
MRRGIATALVYVGFVMVEGGKGLAWLAALACGPIGVIGTIKGNASWLLLIFPGAPAIAGVINVAISAPGGLLLAIGARLKGESFDDYY